MSYHGSSCNTPDLLFFFFFNGTDYIILNWQKKCHAKAPRTGLGLQTCGGRATLSRHMVEQRGIVGENTSRDKERQAEWRITMRQCESGGFRKKEETGGGGCGWSWGHRLKPVCDILGMNGICYISYWERQARLWQHFWQAAGRRMDCCRQGLAPYILKVHSFEQTRLIILNTVAFK